MSPSVAPSGPAHAIAVKHKKIPFIHHFYVQFFFFSFIFYSVGNRSDSLHHVYALPNPPRSTKRGESVRDRIMCVRSHLMKEKGGGKRGRRSVFHTPRHCERIKVKCQWPKFSRFTIFYLLFTDSWNIMTQFSKMPIVMQTKKID